MRSLEIFSCSGGMAEGFRRAGVTFSWAFDHDADACDSYEANLGHRPIQMDVRDLLRMVRDGWSPGPLDLLVADPPCTPWSRAGKRLGTADERDMLRDTAALIAALRPAAYLIGNVPGLQDAPSWHVVQDVIGGLSQHGYCTADYVQLDAADYGVPQHRIRPFWLGHRAGPCLRWPARTHCDPKEAALATLPGMSPLLPWVTCRDALGHLPAEDIGRPVRLRWKTSGHPPSNLDEPGKTVPSSQPGNGGMTLLTGPDHRPSVYDAPARTLTRNTHSDGALLTHSRHPVSEPNSPSMTITTKGDGRGAQGACVVGGWPWDKSSTTVTCRPGLPPPGHHGSSYMSAPNAIVLSELAAKILQGFPESWVFAGKTKRSRWSMLGQAMPPPLAEAVARSVVAQIRSSKSEAA